ncbi:MAG: hypothetical protein GEU81_17125, partial [Nitriliruptorales bacterium]|nr:hypothetical protein [Nitriliruptorales bacterium]
STGPIGWDGTTPESAGIELVGHTDLLGHGDAMHINIKDGIAYVGHMGESRTGTSIVDVSDPTEPRVIRQLEAPIGTHTHKVQLVDDILLVNHERNHREPRARTWSAGLKVYDVSRPDDPKEIGFLPTPGKGVHRMTYWEAPYAYMSGSDEGYSDQFFMIADLSDPSNPVEIGRWWFPGMHLSGGEIPSWDAELRCAKHHHPLLRGDLAFCTWWDLGLVILDIADKERPEFVGHLDFGADVSGCTHTALPVPGTDLLVVTDEAHDDPGEVQKQVRVVDVSDPSNPFVVSTFPVPEGDFRSRGRRFGPHNLHEMRPGTLVDPDRIYVSYFSGGLRVVNVSDPHAPREEAYYIPETPSGQHCIQLNDLMVDADGLIYISDRYHGGVYILRETS